MSAHHENVIRETVQRHYPAVQGIYLFETYGTENERAGILQAFLETGRAYET